MMAKEDSYEKRQAMDDVEETVIELRKLHSHLDQTIMDFEAGVVSQQEGGAFTAIDDLDYLVEELYKAKHSLEEVIYIAT